MLVAMRCCIHDSQIRTATEIIFRRDRSMRIGSIWLQPRTPLLGCRGGGMYRDWAWWGGRSHCIV